MSEISIPTREPRQVPVDDAVVPFEVAALDVRGRVVRLGPALNQILGQHDYPTPVCKLLGEASLSCRTFLRRATPSSTGIRS